MTLITCDFCKASGPSGSVLAIRHADACPFSTSAKGRAPTGEPDTANAFLVGNLDGTIIISGLSPRRLTRLEALNLAAWLLDVADRGPNEEGRAPPSRAVISWQFLRLLEAVQNR
jgi:hypothetical protein